MGREDDTRSDGSVTRLKSGSPRADTPFVAALSNDRSRLEGDLVVIVVGTLAKMLLFVAVIGAVGYDAISVTTTQLTLRDHAQQAAQAGHEAYRAYGTVQAAYAAALAFAQENGDTLVRSGFSTGPNHTVTVQLTREANAVFADHLPRVKDYTVADATASVADPLA